MSLENIVRIIIQAEDKATKQSEKVQDSFNKMSDTAQKANQKAAQSSEKYSQKMQEMAKQTNEVTKNARKVGIEGSNSFKNLSKSQQDAVTKFNMLDQGTQKLLLNMNSLGSSGMPGVTGAISHARQELQGMDNVTKTWSGSLDYAKSKMQLMGTNTDSLKGKLQVVGNGIKTYIGNKWDGLKSKVSNFGSFIKSNLSSALSTVRSKIESLGSTFSGLGGIISSVFGGIGLKSMADMTIGASINRDRIFNLSYAILGAGQSMQSFKKDNDSLWNKMDSDTNKSLVGLDQISQAMSVINMSANASESQLKALEPIILDIGQRAILMGKSGHEAVGLMQAAGKGLNGEFEMLRENLGITKDKLEAAGWDGSAEDIDGYTKALGDCLSQSGDVSDMMNTTSGKLTRLQKYWGLAGRSLGDQFLPYVDKALDHLVNFLDADNDGALDQRGKQWIQYAYGAMAVASGFATLAPSINPALQVFDNLTGKTKSALQFLGIMKAEEDALTLATLRESAAQKISAATKWLSATAAGAYNLVVGVLTGNITLATAATQVWNAVMAANPIGLIIVALAALAVAVYEVGKHFGWWKDVNGMLESIKAGVMRLWAAFINNHNVQGFIKDLGNAWNFVCEALQPVFDWAKKTWNELFPSNAGSNFDIVRVIIDLFGGLGRIFGDVVNGIKIMYAQFGLFGAILGIVTAPAQAIVAILRTVICALIGCSPGIVPALEKVQEMFTTVWTYIVGFIGGIIGGVVSALQPVLNVLTSIGNFLLGAFRFAWSTVVLVFAIVRSHITVLMLVFNRLLSGQISLSSALGMIWNTIRSMYIMVLSTIVQRVSTFAWQIISKAIEAGRGFFNGIISFISNLPGNVSMYLYSVVSTIISAGASWISNAASQASSMVSSVMSNVSQLPDRVGQEFMNIGSRIVSAGSDLINKAENIGKNIVDGLLGAMGIHSPGIIQTKVVTEFKDMVSGVEDQMGPAGEIAREFGDTMVDQFGDVDLTPNLGYKDLDMPEMNMNIGIDTAAVNSTNQMVQTSYDQLATQTGASLNQMVNQDMLAYQKIKQNDETKLNQMVTTDKLAYNKIRQNDNTQLSSITNNLKNKMNTMTTKVKTSLDTMIEKNKTGLNSARQTTQKQLDDMTTATTKANEEMIKSWGVMKDGIIDAADRIRSDSTNHFDRLSSTIGSFYNKLRNPGSWGAGSPNTTSRGSSSRGFGKITQAIRNASLPSYLTLGQIQRNPLIDSSNFGDYVIRNPKNNLFEVTDLIRYGIIKPGKGAGSYDSIPEPHVKLIKDTSNEWDMKGPLIGKYSIDKGFKVKDFITGVPKFSYDEFRGIAEDVFGQTEYEFYYDDDHHGNWVNAFNAGSMNCKHGAEALIALASVFGLSGYMEHGHWNQYGHYFARIEGRKMDVTGWQNRRTWTPSASAGPAPRGSVFDDFIDELRSSKESDVVVNGSNDAEVNGEVTVRHIHEFIDLPEGVSAEEVARLINNAPEDDNWLIKLIKKLVKDKDFQKLDLNEKARIERRNKRALGV